MKNWNMVAMVLRTVMQNLLYTDMNKATYQNSFIIIFTKIANLTSWRHLLSQKRYKNLIVFGF